jgi:riboflavin kinase
LKELTVKGRIFSGKREGSRFMGFPWVVKQMTENLGFIPYRGTLNVRISKRDSTRLREAMNKAKSIQIQPAEGFCLGRCFKVMLADNLGCAMVVPEVEWYPENVVEIIAPTNLREQLCLKDGDAIKIKVML